MVKVFDLDGTLLDSNRIWREIDRTVVRRFGCELTAEYNSFVSHATFPEAAKFTKEYYHLSITEEEIMDAWHSLAFDAYASQLPLKPGAGSYLNHCVAKKEHMALYTSSEPSLCRAALANHHIDTLFEELYFAQELGLDKIRSASFRTISGFLHTAPEECVLFDDSPEVCAAAKESGWNVVGVRDDFYIEEQPKLKKICDRYIEEFSVLLPQTSGR